MNQNEKKISFLNNYFVFKKIRQVDAEAIYRSALGEAVIEEKPQESKADEEQIVIKEPSVTAQVKETTTIKKKVKKGTRKKTTTKPKLKIVED